MDEKHLQSLISKSNSTDLAFLLKAKEMAKGRMQKDPSKANIAAFEKADRALRERMAEPGTGDAKVGKSDIPDPIPTRNQVAEHLRGLGYTMSTETV